MGWELEWSRPAGLVALCLPLVLLLSSRRRTEPEPRATGTLAIWREVLAHSPRASGAERRARVPLPVWLAALALSLGALALGGPRPAATPVARRWTVVVDPSPSLALPAPERPESLAGDEPRLARALGDARAWLAAHAHPLDRVRWISPVRPTLELSAGEPPDAAWLAPPAFHAPEPEWALFDLPGALFVTDVSPAPPPRAAGLFASGARPAPGPIGVAGRDRLDWDGERVVRTAGAAPARRAALDPRVPEVLRRAFRAWAEARGFALDGGGDAELVLALERADGSADAGAEVLVGRDGWTARARATAGQRVPRVVGAFEAADPFALTEVWLSAPSDEDPLPLVVAAPGHVRVALAELAEPTGDPAAFAVSCARLFDRCALPPRGSAPLAERALAGERAERAPEPAPPIDGARAGPQGGARARPAAGSLEAWLVVATLVAAVGALSAGLVRR